MKEQQAIGLWAIVATVVAFVMFVMWSDANRKWDAVMGDNAEYTIEDVVQESQENDRVAERIAESYNQLSQNAQEECDIIENYFGAEPADLCMDTIFDGLETDVSTGDLSTDARDGLKSQIDYALNPPDRD